MKIGANPISYGSGHLGPISSRGDSFIINIHYRSDLHVDKDLSLSLSG